MKLLSAPTRAIVYFSPSGDTVPVYFLYKGRRIKIDRVIQCTRTRKTFNNCMVYRCESSGAILELRWDRDRDIWYIDKM